MHKLGVIAPMRCESAWVLHPSREIAKNLFRITDNLFVYFSGVGSDNAARAAKLLLGQGKGLGGAGKLITVDALVSWGFAGALDPDLKPGQIILPTQVVDVYGDFSYAVDSRWHGALKSELDGALGVGKTKIMADPARVTGSNPFRNWREALACSALCDGTIVSTQEVKSTHQEKKNLRRTTKAIAVDMESATIARVAGELGKPFVVVRSISDTVKMQLPPSALGATDECGKLHQGRLVAGLLKKPGELMYYPALVYAVTKARKSLKRVLELCGDDLCAAALSER